MSNVCVCVCLSFRCFAKCFFVCVLFNTLCVLGVLPGPGFFFLLSSASYIAKWRRIRLLCYACDQFMSIISQCSTNCTVVFVLFYVHMVFRSYSICVLWTWFRSCFVNFVEIAITVSSKVYPLQWNSFIFNGKSNRLTRYKLMSIQT